MIEPETDHSQQKTQCNPLNRKPTVTKVKTGKTKIIEQFTTILFPNKGGFNKTSYDSSSGRNRNNRKTAQDFLSSCSALGINLPQKSSSSARAEH
jgi:hypothetical protein